MPRLAAVLVRLHLRRLWAQRLRTVLAVGAVAAGTSLALGVVIVLSSTTASLDALGRSVAGPAPLRVVGPASDGGIPPAVPAEVAATPGVAQVVPMVQVSSVVHGAGGIDRAVLVLGAGCRVAALVGLRGCTGGAAGPTTVLVGDTLARWLGPRSWLQTDLGTLPLATAVRSRRLDAVAGGQVAVTGLARAQLLFDRGRRSDVVYVLLRPGADVVTVQARIAARLGPAFGVLTAAQPPPAVGLATAAFVPLLVLVAAIAAAIAAVLVYDVVTLSLEERRRQQAVLGAVGAPPWLLAAGPAVEAAAVGAVGGLLAVGGGAALAGPVLAPLSAFTASVFGAPVSVHLRVVDGVLGAAFGVLVGLGAAARPVARTARSDIAAELAERPRRAEASPRAAGRRTGLGAAAFAAGTVLAYAGSRHGALASWQLPAAAAGFLVAVAAGALMVGSGATLPFAALAARRGAVTGPGRRRGWRRPLRARVPAPVRIGVAAAGRDPGRVGVMAVAVAAAVGVGTVTAGYAQGLAAQLDPAPHGRPGGAVVVETVAGASGDNPAAALPAVVAGAVSRVPQVAAVHRFTAVLSGSSAASLVLVEAAGSPAGGPSLVAGSARPGPFRRGAVMVGTGLARGRHLHAGGRVGLDTPSGVVTVPVEGIWDDGAVDGDNVTMDSGELTRLYGPQLPQSLTVVPAAGTTAARLMAELRRLPLPADVTLTAAGAYRRQQAGQLTGQLAPFWTLEHGLLGVAFVGVLATLLLVGVGRRREVAVLGAVGLAPAGVFGLVVSEAVAVAVVGAAGGVVLGAAALAVMLMVVPIEVGFTVPYAFDAGVLVGVVPLAVALSAAAALLPAWQAARHAVVDGLRQE